MESTSIYKIKDSVDLFLSDGRYIMVYYMNTRQRKSFRVNRDLIHMLENIDGIKTESELCNIMLEKYNIDSKSVHDVLQILISHRIVSIVNTNNSILTNEQIEKYTRQINYFSEFLESEEGGLVAQKKVMDAHVLIFGCGAIGGSIAIELAMAGIRRLTLYDYDLVESSDVARHIYYHIGMKQKKKSEALKNELLKISSDIEIDIIDESMKPTTSIEDMIIAVDFVVNTLDEPYIGYTASKISRICVKHKIAHYIAGGFDAHLASTGELIIPYTTPCVECYASHFKEKLQNWKPKKHPVKIRCSEIGGLASMALFSASFASIEIIKYLAGLVDTNKQYKVRGEFLFNDFSLTYLAVHKNPDCPVCGGTKL